MKFFCTPRFKEEYDKLCSKKNYTNLPKAICDYFSNKTKDELLTGSRIYNIPNQPYIKKRLRGSGGYRIDYQLIMRADGEVVLIFVYPKTGPFGRVDLEGKTRKDLLADLLHARESDELIELSLNQKKGLLEFKLR